MYKTWKISLLKIDNLIIIIIIFMKIKVHDKQKMG